jgi:hypothetical protein
MIGREGERENIFIYFGTSYVKRKKCMRGGGDM